MRGQVQIMRMLSSLHDLGAGKKNPVAEMVKYEATPVNDLTVLKPGNPVYISCKINVSGKGLDI